MCLKFSEPPACNKLKRGSVISKPTGNRSLRENKRRGRHVAWPVAFAHELTRDARAAGEPVRVRVNRGERDGPGGVAAAVRGGGGAAACEMSGY